MITSFPAALTLAVRVTGIPEHTAEALRKLAWPVSAAAAEPCDQTLRTRAQEATSKLEPHFHASAETLRASGFLGLAYTLPAMLANGCYALCRSPAQWSLLHREPEIAESTVEELMRYAGLTRTLKRRATEDLMLGGEMIRAGDRLILQVEEANHDPASFEDAAHLLLTRRSTGQLTLGAGLHACVAAGLLRSASALILRLLTSGFAAAIFVETVEWKGGSGFRSPDKLLVELSRQQAPSSSATSGVSAESISPTT